jgi:hypothetical protein
VKMEGYPQAWSASEGLLTFWEILRWRFRLVL